jgi:hypothetical protein
MAYGLTGCQHGFSTGFAGFPPSAFLDARSESGAGAAHELRRGRLPGQLLWVSVAVDAMVQRLADRPGRAAVQASVGMLVRAANRPADQGRPPGRAEAIPGWLALAATPLIVMPGPPITRRHAGRQLGSAGYLP